VTQSRPNQASHTDRGRILFFARHHALDAVPAGELVRSPTEECALNRWHEVRDEFFAWLRAFPLQINIGKPGDSPEVIGPTEAPVCVDVAFWSD
jgi:hypothetical protein